MKLKTLLDAMADALIETGNMDTLMKCITNGSSDNISNLGSKLQGDIGLGMAYVGTALIHYNFLQMGLQDRKWSYITEAQQAVDCFRRAGAKVSDDDYHAEP